MNNNRQTKNLCFSTDRFKSLQLFFINVLAKYFQSFCLRKRRIFFQRVITLTFLKQNLDVLLILMEMMKYYRRILMLLLLSFMFLCWFVSLPRLQFWNKDCLNGQLIGKILYKVIRLNLCRLLIDNKLVTRKLIQLLTKQLFNRPAL